MKHIFLLCFVIALAATAFSQTEQPPPTTQPSTQTAPQTAPQAPPQTTPGEGQLMKVAETMSWIVGEWQGEGVQQGQAFTTSLSATPALDGEAILMRRNSSSGFKEFLLMGFAKGSDKVVASLYDSQNHTGLFTATVTATEAVLTQVTAASGFQSRRIFRLLNDGSLYFAVEGASPGESMSKRLEATLKKK